MNVFILAIGNELLNGDIVDTNSSFIERELSAYSLQVRKVSIVPDDQGLIRAEIRRGVEEFSHIFIMGGLGPTEDDVTREAVAEALGRRLSMDPGDLQVLKGKFESCGRVMSANNEKQAFFPEGSQILHNPIGTACGFFLREKGCSVFALPGVPSEMKRMLMDQAVPILEGKMLKTKRPERLVVKTIGTGESVVDSIIREKIIPRHPVRWEILAGWEGIFIKFYPIKEDSGWKARLREDMQACLGDFIYGYGEEDMGSVVAKLLAGKNLTLGCVESCTGGYISKYLTDRAGSSEYFVGGLVAYSNDLKIRLAGVYPALLARHGAVSVETAEALAIGGKKALGCDVCLSVTGIAGPGGGSEEKPVGTVCFGLVDHLDRLTVERRVFSGDRADVREKALFYGLNLVRLRL